MPVWPFEVIILEFILIIINDYTWNRLGNYFSDHNPNQNSPANLRHLPAHQQSQNCQLRATLADQQLSSSQFKSRTNYSKQHETSNLNSILAAEIHHWGYLLIFLKWYGRGLAQEIARDFRLRQWPQQE